MMKVDDLLADMRTRDRYDEQVLPDGSVYFRVENVKATDFTNYLAVLALMRLNIPKEQWLGEE